MENEKQVTIVILSEPEAKEVSARHSLRCIGRDIGYLFRALAGNLGRFMNVMSRAWVYKNCWWTHKR